MGKGVVILAHNAVSVVGILGKVKGQVSVQAVRGVSVSVNADRDLASVSGYQPTGASASPPVRIETVLLTPDARHSLAVVRLSSFLGVRQANGTGRAAPALVLILKVSTHADPKKVVDVGRTFRTYRPCVVVKVLGFREVPVLFGNTGPPAYLLKALMGTSIVTGRLETGTRLLGTLTVCDGPADPASPRGVSERNNTANAAVLHTGGMVVAVRIKSYMDKGYVVSGSTFRDVLCRGIVTSTP